MAEIPPVIPPVSVLLDRERPFIITMGTLRRAELRLRELTGKDLSILEVIAEVGRTRAVALTELSVILWAGLQAEDAKLTDDQVLALLTPGRIKDVMRAFGEATAAFFTPEGEGSGEASTGRPFGSTGSTAGATPGAVSGSPTPTSGT